MYICYGISNGPINNLEFLNDWEEDRYLWRTPLGCGIVVEKKDDLVLTVPEFDPTKSTAVKITLARKGVAMPLVEFMVNSYGFVGKPELVWGGDT